MTSSPLKQITNLKFFDNTDNSALVIQNSHFLSELVNYTEFCVTNHVLCGYVFNFYCAATHTSPYVRHCCQQLRVMS